MIYPILYYGEPVLRRRASPVEAFDDELERLAADMLETMYAADGVGLAAPQIGLDKRLFVALEVQPDEEPEGGTGQSADVDAAGDDAGLDRAAGDDAGVGSWGVDSHAGDSDAGDSDAVGSDEPLTEDEKRRAWGVVREHVIVNPVMLESTGRQLARDGCLSLPGLVAEDVPRPTFVALEYQDLAGRKHRLEAEGYFAHVLQHEYDHLEGVLYFDHLPKDRREAFLEEHRAQLAEWQRLARARAKAVASAGTGAPVRSRAAR